MNPERLVALGVISAPHGVRGQVKIRSFTADPRDLTSYGPLSDRAGRTYTIKITGTAKEAFIATIEGVITCEDAERLRNTELCVKRSALPAARPGQYYHEDLRGLKLTTDSGEAYGTIAAIHNFGAGDLLAVRRPNGEEEFIPFSQSTFTSIDTEKGIGVIVPPEVVRE